MGMTVNSVKEGSVNVGIDSNIEISGRLCNPPSSPLHPLPLLQPAALCRRTQCSFRPSPSSARLTTLAHTADCAGLSPCALAPVAIRAVNGHLAAQL